MFLVRGNVEPGLDAHVFAVAEGLNRLRRYCRRLPMDLLAHAGEILIEFPWGSLDLPEDFTPVGYTDIDVVCLAIRGPETEKLFLWVRNREPEDIAK